MVLAVGLVVLGEFVVVLCLAAALFDVAVVFDGGFLEECLCPDEYDDCEYDDDCDEEDCCDDGADCFFSVLHWCVVGVGFFICVVLGAGGCCFGDCVGAE